MDYKVKELPNSAREVSVKLDDAYIKPFEEKALKQLQKRTVVKGFRKGKAPLAKVKAEVGAEQIQAHQMNMVLQSAFEEVLKKESLSPISRPNADIKGDDPLEVVYTFDVMPTVKAVDLKKIKVTPKPIEIAKKDIEEAKQNILNAQSSWKTLGAETEAKTDMRVEIDFTGTIDGKAFDGGTAKRQVMIIGEGKFLPDFEKGVQDMKTGEKNIIKVSFPKDYQSDELQGKTADFEILLHSIAERALPEMDEAFIKKISNDTASTPAEFDEFVEKHLTELKAKEVKDEAYDDLINQILKLGAVDAPQSMINDEKEFMLQNINKDLEKYKMELPSYLAMKNISEEDFMADIMKEAEKRVTLRMNLLEIGNDLEITVDPEEVQEAFAKHDDGQKRDKEEQVFIKQNLYLQLKLNKVYAMLEERFLTMPA